MACSGANHRGGGMTVRRHLTMALMTSCSIRCCSSTESMISPCLRLWRHPVLGWSYSVGLALVLAA